MASLNIGGEVRRLHVHNPFAKKRCLLWPNLKMGSETAACPFPINEGHGLPKAAPKKKGVKNGGL
jgi:hypothetical protein